MSHTKTPWALDGDGEHFNGAFYGTYIAKAGDGRVAQTFTNCLVDDEACRANAAYIVRAVNSHDALVAALKALRDQLVSHPEIDMPGSTIKWAWHRVNDALAIVEAA